VIFVLVAQAIGAFQSTFEFKAFCKSVWFDNVHVIPHHVADHQGRFITGLFGSVLSTAVPVTVCTPPPHTPNSNQSSVAFTFTTMPACHV
jgi:hypothetical protein